MRYAVAVLALGALVALHELGHFLVARAFRIRVLRFSIGFGPAVFSWKRGETAYTLGALPLGGFVQIQGMSPNEEGLSPGDPRVFLAQAPWKRVVVLAAGSALNYALAVLLLAGLYFRGTHVPVPMTVGAVEPDSEAARAQLRSGDRLLSVDGAPLERWSDLVDLVNDRPGQSLNFSVVRDGVARSITLRPRPDEEGVGRIGVSQQSVFREVGAGEALVEGFAHANGLLGDAVGLLFRLARGHRGAELSTPVGIVRQASDAAAGGADTLIRILAAISMALALFNLLPFPALDGGRILFAVAEGLLRRRVSSELETVLHAAGFIILLVVLALVSAREIRRLLPPAPAPTAHP